MSLALPQPEALARASLLTVALLLLSACGPSPEEQRAAAEAAAQAREAKVAPTLALYREAKAKGDAALALASATVVMTDAPGSAAAAEVEANLESLREEAAAQAETKRLQGLWAYLSSLIDGEVTAQRSASMRNLKPEGSEETVMAPPTVQLVLRNDPRWGQSTYLVIEDGVFDCGRPCAFQLRFSLSTTTSALSPRWRAQSDLRFCRRTAKGRLWSLKWAALSRSATARGDRKGRE